MPARVWHPQVWAELDQQLDETQVVGEDTYRPCLDLGEDALVEVLDGERPGHRLAHTLTSVNAAPPCSRQAPWKSTAGLWDVSFMASRTLVTADHRHKDDDCTIEVTLTRVEPVLLAPLPVERPTSLMRDREDADLVLAQRVQKRVREIRQEPLAYAGMQRRG